VDKLISIGKMAELQGISEKTLRKYHKIGLFDPVIVDQKTGYRYYSVMQSPKLDLIERLKEMGFTLKEIKNLLGSDDEMAVNDLFDAHIGKLEEKQRQLRLAQESLTGMRTKSRLLDRHGTNGKIFIEQYPERKYLSFELGDDAYSLTDNSRDAETNLYRWELSLRRLKAEFVKNNIPKLLFQNAGCKIRQKDLLARNLFISEAFLFLSESDRELFPRMKTLVAPQGFYLCMYCDGVIYADGTYKELKYLEYLLDAIDQRSYVIAGDYFGEVLTDGHWSLSAKRDLHIKLQIPIAFNGTSNTI